MTTIVYTAYPQSDLERISAALDSKSANRAQIVGQIPLPKEGSRRYLRLPQLWRVLQAVFTGSNDLDNEQLVASIDGIEYLDGWSNIGAAYINAVDVPAIARALAQVNFAQCLEVFNAVLKQNAVYADEKSLLTGAVQFKLDGCDEFAKNKVLGRSEELSTWFERLCGFYRAAAEDGHGVIIEFVEQQS